MGHAHETIFLVGAERSGTTMLRLMLDHHPEIAWQNEFEFAVDRLSDDNGWPAVDEYELWLSTHRVFAATEFQIDNRLSYPDLVRSFLEQRRLRARARIVGATVHRHFDRVLRIWADARFIHLVRDPRDVARSCVAMGWAGNVWTGAARWVDAECTWERLRAQLSPDRQVEVKYEDLVADPEGELRRVCAFAGVEFDPAMLNYPEQTTYEAPDPAQRGQWHWRMTPWQWRLVEARVGELLTMRGYERSGQTPLRVTTMLRRLLLTQNRVSRALFRVRKYGPSLWVLTAISSRFGPGRWRRRVQLRCNEVDRSHLK